jgi:hypothetical protein
MYCYARISFKDVCLPALEPRLCHNHYNQTTVTLMCDSQHISDDLHLLEIPLHSNVAVHVHLLRAITMYLYIVLSTTSVYPWEIEMVHYNKRAHYRLLLSIIRRFLHSYRMFSLYLSS